MKHQNYDWLLVGCHSISEVAVAYFPNYARTTSSVRALRKSFDEQDPLRQELIEAGYTPKTLHFTPQQIAVLIRYWGMPDCVERLRCSKSSETI